MKLNKTFVLLHKRQRKPKGKSRMDNAEKLAAQGTKGDEKQTQTQHNMSWTPLNANKHK